MIGRKLFNSRWVLDIGAWPYHLLTENRAWHTNCGRLLDGVPVGTDRLRVLDLGVGPGVSALAMGRRYPNLLLIGIDVGQRMLELAAANRRDEGWPAGRFSLLRADALRLPLKDESVDVVTGHSLLYLLEESVLALREAFRVLRPGGYVSFLEPRAGNVSWSWLWRQRSIRLFVSASLWRWYSRLHRRYSPSQLSTLLDLAGFKQPATEETLGGFGIFVRARKP
jgi:ubiquinone/menaquinone biosynthesis C-methylase UbiE